MVIITEDTITQRLDDKEIEYANLLRKTGFGTCVAKIVVALVSGSKTQKELGICVDESQGVVSVVLRKLVAKNLVNVSEIMSQSGKGRPRREYTLISWDAVIDTIEKEAFQKHENEIAQIERLKELTY